MEAEIAAQQAETDRQLEADITAAEARIGASTAAAANTIKAAARDTARSIVHALIDETPSDDALDMALARAAV
jgi:F0F1-type ATP synthase membrane subunit b/b'